MPRAQRREQILAAATRAFARAGGFAPTSLDDVAAEAGVTRMILYRHFDSKDALYRAVLDRAGTRMYEATTVDGEITEDTVPYMLHWAAAEPDGFRLLFHHAAREPDYRADIDEAREAMIAVLRPMMSEYTDSEAWAGWGARLATIMVVESIMAWLDAGQPDPDLAVDRVLLAVDGIYNALRDSPGPR
ncbi:TetR/AcrR family transcriptional regulator [Amycolatopsis suaedae]|uniref:TetR/AcrR family transcriptional regulator n=2 Tax=Amycolatopsis suaedae TaxID=2510978 RepID=A0A4Q7J267_9PSEU|nr:TetR/AcrR family transcriptional regulator [Amycolatopsis suaedae]